MSLIKKINPFAAKPEEAPRPSMLRRAISLKSDKNGGSLFGKNTVKPLDSDRSDRPVPPRTGKYLWNKTRSLIRAISSWKSVRNDVLLYGTHNYEFRRTFNVIT